MSRNTRAASAAKPYRRKPSAMMPLSCGHTDPSWYENGIVGRVVRRQRADPPAAPHVGLHQPLAPRAPRAPGSAMPLHRQWPALEATVSMGIFFGSSPKQ